LSGHKLLFVPNIDKQNQAKQSLAFARPLLSLCLAFAQSLLGLCSTFARQNRRRRIFLLSPSRLLFPASILTKV